MRHPEKLQTSAGNSNGKSVIQVTGVTVTNWPIDERYSYKCRIALRSPSGETLLSTEAPPRRIPHWVLNIKHHGDCTAQIDLLARGERENEPWQDVGHCDFNVVEELAGQPSTEIQRPVPTWAAAPDLRFDVRLTNALGHKSTGGLAIAYGLGTSPTLSAPSEDRASIESLDELDALSLSVQEQVIVKDTWNKLLAFEELMMEMFFKRMLIEQSDLNDLFGDFTDDMPDYFFGLFDLCVRSLLPQTERVLRESYQAVHPSPDRECNTLEEYGKLFADLGMRAEHWQAARKVWLWMLPKIPYLGEYEAENMETGSSSALYKFFSKHVMAPMFQAVIVYDEALTSKMIKKMKLSWEDLSDNRREAGIRFYQRLFQNHPEVLPFFGRTNVDQLATHLISSFDFLMNCLASGEGYRREIRELGRTHRFHGIPADAYSIIAEQMISLLEEHNLGFAEPERQAWQCVFDRVTNIMKRPAVREGRLKGKAAQFLDMVADEQQWESSSKAKRWREIEREIHATGTYTQTYEELTYGVRVAWRNSAKCIGRIAWNSLIVRDCREVTDPDAIFEECREHVRIASAGTNLEAVLTLFRPKNPGELWGPRIWNPQLFRYAAYEQADGSIVGDKANLALTRKLQSLGWQPPNPISEFDLLPIVIDVPGHPVRMYEFPRDEVREVLIEHPTIPEFASLGLRWVAIPALSNFRVELGGVDYGCIPFNGWFMGTEIARNLWEENRYGKANAIANVLDLDTSSESTLWRDRAFLELNVAVLHSFQKASVSMVDHQTASQQFLTHDLREKRAGRETPAQWSWIVPPAGGSTCPVWHHEMRDFLVEPQYHYAADKWAVEDGQVVDVSSGEADQQESGTDRLLILFGSETGTAERYARQAARKLKVLRPLVLALDDCNASMLAEHRRVLALTSTFGDGEFPGNARQFMDRIRTQADGSHSHLGYAVMALGSRIYPKFCAAGAALDRELRRLGGRPLVPLHKGDELQGQAETFQEWLGTVAAVLGHDETTLSTADIMEASRLAIQFGSTHVSESLRETSHHGVEVPVLANCELLNDVVSGSRSTRQIVFDISNTGLEYLPGDHVAVHPINPPAQVERLCRRLRIDPDTSITMSYQTPDGQPTDDPVPFPGVMTVRELLGEELDLTLQEPFEELFNAMYERADDSQERRRLEHWMETLALGKNNEQALTLKQEIADTLLDLPDLLEAFSSVSLELETLVELLPRQKPRLYSISSSPQLLPGELHITVGVVTVETNAGKTRPGLCSNYLAGLSPHRGDTARIAVRSSHFRLPEDPEAPILMIGPGTGIAPLISFCQHREALFKADPPHELGSSTLYFGCRNLNDFLYRDQLESWKRQGILNELEVAFSRISEEKVYVQHLLQKNSREIWELLRDPRCHYYVCGDSKMADDVYDVLLSIAHDEGRLSYLETVDFFDRMKAEKRFTTDVWGVTLNYKEAIDAVRKRKYAQAEHWLKRVNDAETVGV